jgi:UDP-N-acetylglucosamine 2-epimerase (non-hydrolysing)
MRKKVLFVFGTRPEAIKMIPVFKEFETYSDIFDTKICVTGQHREMLDTVMSFFGVIPHYDLNLMQPNQKLEEIVSKIITLTSVVYESFQPDFVFVHGDTITCMGASFAAFLKKIKICHVEAGLRTNDRYSPFPEEMNRQIVSRLSDIHFAPTINSQENLVKENVSSNTVYVTGNTVIDALIESNRIVNDSQYQNGEITFLKNIIFKNKIILVTGHRRENFGDGFQNICKALKIIAERNQDCQIIYPVHLNPNVNDVVHSFLDNIENISLIKPLDYPSFVWLMSKSSIIITDSGGVQEEAPSLGKPVLVMRDNTERPEAVDAGTVILVGTDVTKIVAETNRLLGDEHYYNSFSNKNNPYGDGTASKKIVKIIRERYNT